MQNAQRDDLKNRAYRFSLALIQMISIANKGMSNEIICRQLLRSGTSIGANLVEARASTSRLEYKKFHEIALKSANETIYRLDLLRDSNNRAPSTIDTLRNEVDQLSRMIGSGVIKLKSK